MRNSPSRAIPRMTRYDTSPCRHIFLILITILGLIQNSKASNHGLNDELHFIHREIGLLRDENHNQNQEINMLKEMMGLQNRDHHITAESLDNQIADEKESSQHKRPARLLPRRILLGEQRNFTADMPVRKFYGPPTNCSDLSQLGYTLNGFYLVQAQTENSSTSTIKDSGDKIQVEVISCTFKHPEGIYKPSNIIEKKTSNLGLGGGGNGGIHFRARLITNVESSKPINILFDDILFNYGDGFYNAKTGHFTIPKTGIYHINFSGLIQSPSASQTNLTYIYLMVNDAHLKFMDGTKILDGQLTNRILQSTVELAKGQNISILIKLSGIGKTFELKKTATFSCSLLN